MKQASSLQHQKKIDVRKKTLVEARKRNPKHTKRLPMKVQGKNLFEEFDDDYDEYLPYEDRHDANVAEAQSKMRRFEIPQDRDTPKLVNIEKAIIDMKTWERYFKDRNNKDWKYEPL